MDLKQELVIDKVRDEVWSIFVNYDYLIEWMPTLKSKKAIQGEQGRPGAATTFVLEEQGKINAFKETILQREDPYYLLVERVSDEAKHTIKHTFEQLPSESTLWIIEHSIIYFNFKKYMPFVFKQKLINYVSEYQQNFKSFVESF